MKQKQLLGKLHILRVGSGLSGWIAWSWLFPALPFLSTREMCWQREGDVERGTQVQEQQQELQALFALGPNIQCRYSYFPLGSS